MTAFVVHQCPKCQLRFSFRTELEYHLREDHRQPQTVDQAPAAEADQARNTGSLRAASLATTPIPAGARRHSTWTRTRLAGLLLAIAAVVMVTYTAVSASISSAVVVAAAALMLSIVYLRRLRGRARVPGR